MPAMIRSSFAVLFLGVTGCTIFLPQPVPPPPRWRVIHIVAGGYGQNCRAAYGNTTTEPRAEL